MLREFVFAAVLLQLAPYCLADYLPSWDSIDSRPLPGWYDEGKLGIFIHWGVFSVPSFRNEWFWKQWKRGEPDYVKFMKDQYPPSFTYQDFASQFDAYMFDPVWWARLIQDAGAKYVVLTSKHHEGFTLWPSNVSFSWNAKDVGPNRDLVGELAAAIRNTTDVRFGLYHSLFEWFNPLYAFDQDHGFQTNRFVTDKTMPELYELVNSYQPEVIWSDGDEGASDTYWNSTVFLAWLYNKSPVKDTVVVNDRWGAGISCHHGGYWTCQDKYNPGRLINHKWENCYTLDKESWGYRREAALSDYLSELEVISVLAQTVSCGGNLLLNMGPRKDGKIDPLMEERLRQLGKWLRVNGEGIYGTKPWLYQNETNSPVWYTAKTMAASDNSKSNFVVYAILLSWPSNSSLYLSRISPTKRTIVTMLGYKPSILTWDGFGGVGEAGILVDLSTIQFQDMPSTVAWTLKIENIASKQQQIHPVVVKNYIFS